MPCPHRDCLLGSISANCSRGVPAQTLPRQTLPGCFDHSRSARLLRVLYTRQPTTLARPIGVHAVPTANVRSAPPGNAPCTLPRVRDRSARCAQQNYSFQGARRAERKAVGKFRGTWAPPSKVLAICCALRWLPRPVPAPRSCPRTRPRTLAGLWSCNFCSTEPVSRAWVRAHAWFKTVSWRGVSSRPRRRRYRWRPHPHDSLTLTLPARPPRTCALPYVRRSPDDSPDRSIIEKT